MIPTDQNWKEQLLEQAGRRAAQLREDCEVCGGDGVVVKRGTGSLCICAHRAQLEMKLRLGNVPAGYFGDPPFDVRTALDDFDGMAARLRGGNQVSLALQGTNGTGKTTVAIELLKHAAVYPGDLFRIEAVEVARAMSMIKSSMRWVDAWLQKGLFKPVLAIDEMGAEFARALNGAEARALLSYTVKHRHEQGLSTILCSNLSRDEFKEVFGETLSSVVYGSKFHMGRMISADGRAD